MMGGFRAVILLGLVSLLGDLIYEGGRSIIPDYLRVLGASALVVGVVTGLGEMVMQVVKLGSGALADRTRTHWHLIFLGYGAILAIPLLSLASSWELAAALIVVERLGKALRTAPRDAVLSAVSRSMGAGKAFGLHEAVDQLGAVAGPALMLVLLALFPGGYGVAFASTLPAYAALLAIMAVAYGRLRAVKPEVGGGGAPSGHVWLLTLLASLNSVGLVYAPLILYRASAILSPSGQTYLVPLIYLVVQLVDMAVAPAVGFLYDRYGLKTLAIPLILTIPSSATAFLAQDFLTLLLSAAFFGSVLGMQESVYRAAVSEMGGTATSYGLLNTGLGVSAFLSGVIYGMLMDFGAPSQVVIAYILATQAAALLTLARMKN
ncbi:MAG: MFS transporter [Nitrososphaerota archaeon]